jgi:hypothetical protein
LRAQLPPPAKQLHPWQAKEQQALRAARKAKQAAALQKRLITAAALTLPEGVRPETPTVTLPETPGPPPCFQLPPYLTPPHGEVALDRLSFDLINGLLGLPSAAPRRGAVDPPRSAALTALTHAFFGGAIPRLRQLDRAAEAAADFRGGEDHDATAARQELVAATSAQDDAPRDPDGRALLGRALDASGAVVRDEQRQFMVDPLVRRDAEDLQPQGGALREGERWASTLLEPPRVPAVPVPAAGPRGSSAALKAAGGAAMGEGLGQPPKPGGAVDWVRRLRRAQRLPVPTMWAILPSDPNPRLEPGRAAAAQEPFRPRCLKQLALYPAPLVDDRARDCLRPGESFAIESRLPCGPEEAGREWLEVRLGTRYGWVKALLGVEVEVPPLDTDDKADTDAAILPPRPEVAEGGRPPVAQGVSAGGDAVHAPLPQLMPSRWARLEQWGRQSFSLHLMCEWEHGHFLHERYAYPIFKPKDTLARLAPLYQKLLIELAGEGTASSPNLLDRCPHPIPVDKIRADLGIEKRDYRLDFRDFDVRLHMLLRGHRLAAS